MLASSHNNSKKENLNCFVLKPHHCIILCVYTLSIRTLNVTWNNSDSWMQKGHMYVWTINYLSNIGLIKQESPEIWVEKCWVQISCYMKLEDWAFHVLPIIVSPEKTYRDIPYGTSSSCQIWKCMCVDLLLKKFKDPNRYQDSNVRPLVSVILTLICNTSTNQHSECRLEDSSTVK